MTKGFTHESAAAQSVEWYTPPWIFETLRLEFDLDPASPPEGPLPWIPAQKFLSPAEDGRLATWQGRVWLNPPYTGIARWMQRMAEHRNGVALAFARTDPAWFHDYLRTADCILFLRGRVRFVDRDARESGSPGSGSLLAAWGVESAEAVTSFAREGLLWRRP